MGMTGPQYVYIAPGWIIQNGQDFPGPLAPCEASKILPALTNTLYVHCVATTENIEDINYNGVVCIIQKGGFAPLKKLYAYFVERTPY